MFLDRILQDKKIEVAERSRRVALADLERLVAEAPPPRDFLGAIKGTGLAVIGEVKRGSPSRGPIRPDLDAASLAVQYQVGGCAAISVLTDAPHFLARPHDLERVRAATTVPVLRKDFLLDEYQIWESRAMGADAVLLIVAALQAGELAHLVRLAGELGMCPLVEVHSAEEVDIALDRGVRLVGVNNRDLRTFQVNLETTQRLIQQIPGNVAVVSESGIAGPREAALVRHWGADAILVGEALVSSADPAGLVRALSETGTGSSRGRRS